MQSLPLGASGSANLTTRKGRRGNPLICWRARQRDVSVLVEYLRQNIAGRSARVDRTLDPDGKALDSLLAVLAEDGESPPAGSPGFPEGVVASNRNAWRNRFYADTLAKEPKIGDATLRQRYSRAITELTEKKRIATVTLRAAEVRLPSQVRCWVQVRWTARREHGRSRQFPLRPFRLVRSGLIQRRHSRRSE